MENATNPPNATAYSRDICHVTGRRAAAASLGITGSRFGCHSGELRIAVQQTAAVTTRATAKITWVVTYPNQLTKRG